VATYTGARLEPSKYKEIIGGRGSVPNPNEKTHSLPRPLAVFKVVALAVGKSENGKEKRKNRVKKKKGEEESGERGGDNG
jgi:hypothetical protein